VQRKGALMTRLLGQTRAARKKILWGPERGWSNLYDDDAENVDELVPYEQGNGLSQTVTVMAS
jgi:hypothetical protein